MNGTENTSGEAKTELDLSGIRTQRRIGQLLVVPFGYIIVFVLRFVYGLTIVNHQEIRQRFKEIAAKNSPLILCPNHLTMVDSIIIQWALVSVPRMFFHYNLFCWNIPAVENYRSKPFWRLVAYLGKCIPIDRNGDAAHIDEVFAKLRHCLRQGDLCMVFPEGTRSRTGRVQTETSGYGVGKIIRSIPESKVLCLYLRGENQETYSDLPRKGDRYYLDMELITPTSSATGLRAVRDYSVQIIGKLKEMEDRHFARVGNGVHVPSAHARAHG